MQIVDVLVGLLHRSREQGRCRRWVKVLCANPNRHLLDHYIYPCDNAPVASPAG